ncbi:MAG: hypothetical protein EAY75_13950 [Bacteroidetes bacterium]|nr:MAG: hypothetical protein EAY75_13950 [Bacteroidota bacterium]
MAFCLDCRLKEGHSGITVCKTKSAFACKRKAGNGLLRVSKGTDSIVPQKADQDQVPAQLFFSPEKAV